MSNDFTRREFLGFVSTASAGWYLSSMGFTGEVLAAAPKGGFFDASGPIQRGLEDTAPAVFFGDEFERAHSILWDIPAYLKKEAAPTEWEKTELAIIGGGVSGLFTAFAYRKVKPILLEQASRFGGNAKGQSWRGIDYGLGSAYFIEPEKSSLLYKFYNELGLSKIIQKAPQTSPIAIDGKLEKGFWSGAAEPEHKAIYAKLKTYLNQVYESKKAPYPEIPPTDAKVQKLLEQLDELTFAEHLERQLGVIPPLMRKALEAYTWSSFGASMYEVSAAAGLNFLAAEEAPVCVAPAGNAGVAEHVLEQTIQAGVPTSHFRSSCLVVKVQVENNQVKIWYQGADGKLKGLIAKAAVMACPKHVVAKILDGIETEREAAISQIEYRSYLTAGVLINRPSKNRFYDVYLVDKAAAAGAPPSQATDLIMGSLGQTRGRNTVLTLYRPLSDASGRKMLMAPGSYPTIRAQFQSQIENELLPTLGFAKKDLQDIRIARWGHALPVAKRGIFAKGLPQILRKPFSTRVFFVEQDNWMTPAFEVGPNDLVLQEPLITAALNK